MIGTNAADMIFTKLDDYVAEIGFIKKGTSVVFSQNKMRSFIPRDRAPDSFTDVSCDGIVIRESIFINVYFPTDTAVMTAFSLDAFKIAKIVRVNYEDISHRFYKIY